MVSKNDVNPHGTWDYGEVSVPEEKPTVEFQGDVDI